MSLHDPCPKTAEFHIKSYLAWHGDAERRYKAGERQRYCLTCTRYVWSDQVASCPIADTITATEQDRRVRLALRQQGFLS